MYVRVFVSQGEIGVFTLGVTSLVLRLDPLRPTAGSAGNMKRNSLCAGTLYPRTVQSTTPAASQRPLPAHPAAARGMNTVPTAGSPCDRYQCRDGGNTMRRSCMSVQSRIGERRRTVLCKVV